MKNKKGFIIGDMTGWFLIGILVLAIIVLSIIILSGKGSNMVEYFKNLFRFGR